MLKVMQAFGTEPEDINAAPVFGNTGIDWGDGDSARKNSELIDSELLGEKASTKGRLVKGVGSSIGLSK